MQAGGSDHVDQSIETKQFDLAAHEVGHARLGDAEHLGGPALAEALAGDVGLTSRFVR